MEMSNHLKLAIVTPSKWLTEQAQKSMLNPFPIYHIPYGINTESYQQIDAKQWGKILGLPIDKKVIMFGAQGLRDSRKGGDILLQTLSKIPTSLKAETVLLMIGNGGETLAKFTGIYTLHLGYLTSDRLKSIGSIHPRGGWMLPITLTKTHDFKMFSSNYTELESMGIVVMARAFSSPELIKKFQDKSQLFVIRITKISPKHYKKMENI
jgi:hypothetical protein